MKILRLIHTMDPVSGGPCQGIRNAIPEWDRTGHQSHVVCLDSPDAAYLKSDELNILPLGPSHTGWGYSKNLLPWLLNHLSDYDAVIVHGLWQYHGYCLSKAMGKLRKKYAAALLPKVFIMPHGMLDPYFQKSPDRKLKAIRNRIYWYFIESKVINRADGLFFTCQEELLLARSTFNPYHPKNEINVGYGVPSPPVYSISMKEAFAEKCPKLKRNAYFLFLSRIHPKKGADILIRVYIELNKQSALLNTKLPSLVIAGPGIETNFGQSLLKLVNDSGLNERILFPGMLNADAKWGAFYGCQVFVLPSHQENFGISVTEAMSCKKPVIISNQVNIWREIQEAKAGIVESDDVNGFLKGMGKYLQLTEIEMNSMGERAQRAFRAHFEVGPAAQKMITSIESYYA